MIQSHFRIGNLINILGEIRAIEGVSNRIRPDCGYYEIEGITRPMKGIHIKTIALNEESLHNLGFVKNKNKDWELFSNNENKIIIIIQNNVVNISFYSKTKTADSDTDTEYSHIYTTTNINNVHELQNLYFALTKKELNININIDMI